MYVQKVLHFVFKIFDCYGILSQGNKATRIFSRVFRKVLKNLIKFKICKEVQKYAKYRKKNKNNGQNKKTIIKIAKIAEK